MNDDELYNKTFGLSKIFVRFRVVTVKMYTICFHFTGSKIEKKKCLLCVGHLLFGNYLFLKNIK